MDESLLQLWYFRSSLQAFEGKVNLLNSSNTGNRATYISDAFTDLCLFDRSADEFADDGEEITVNELPKDAAAVAICTRATNQPREQIRRTRHCGHDSQMSWKQMSL